jgi:hypothetical protein
MPGITSRLLSSGGERVAVRGAGLTASVSAAVRVAMALLASHQLDGHDAWSGNTSKARAKRHPSRVPNIRA